MSINKQKSHYKAIIFDLDGTLLDTLNDIKNALNKTLINLGYEGNYSYEQCRDFIGRGAKKLLERATKNLNLDSDKFDTIYEKFLINYALEQGKSTVPYPNVIQVLESLIERDIKLFIVTNKPNELANAIVRKCLGNYFLEICGKIDDYPPKPTPILIEKIIKKYKLDTKDTLYIGDSIVDCQTATNAEIDFALLTYGYGNYDNYLLSNSTYVLSSFEEVLNLFN